VAWGRYDTTKSRDDEAHESIFLLHGFSRLQNTTQGQLSPHLYPASYFFHALSCFS
jgi:hypothetical protein